MHNDSKRYEETVNYTYGHYTELNPLRIKLAFLRQGVMFPAVNTACELGFGQGLSINLHAAASSVEWWGNDFNPAHVAFAEALAKASGVESHLSDESFLELSQREDLPEFDFIALHGIWSWISPENRQVIVDFMRRKLRPGGVAYVSYNTLPGWAGSAPLRYLMNNYLKTLAPKGDGPMAAMKQALEFAERFMAIDSIYKHVYPEVTSHINKLKTENYEYLVHEYLVSEWYPMYFAEAAGTLESAKLDYVCSAAYLDDIDVIHHTPQQLALLKEVTDPVLRQTMQDFMVNQRFRRDYWVKGTRKLSRQEQAQGFRDQRVVLVTHLADIEFSVTGTIGKCALDETRYLAVLECLADHRPRTLGEMENTLKSKGIGLAEIVEVVLVMTGIGHVSPAQEDDQIQAALRSTEAINSHLLDRAQQSGEISYLSSPVSAGGVAVSQTEQLFIHAIKAGFRTPPEWADASWKIMLRQGKRIVDAGQMITTDAENTARLIQHAERFALKRLSALKALRIIPDVAC